MLTKVKNKLPVMQKAGRWMWKYARKHMKSIIIYTLLGFAGTIGGLVSSLVSKDLIDIITGHNTGELLKTFAMTVGAALFTMLISQVASYVSSMISIRVADDIKADVFDVIMKTEWEEVAHFHSGELMARWSGDSSIVASGILTQFPTFLISLFRLFSALYMVIKYDASFAVIAVLSVPIILVCSQKSLARMQRANQATYATNTRMSSFQQETFTNIQTVKAFDLLPQYTRRLRRLQGAYEESQKRYQKTSNLNSVILSLAAMVTNYMSYSWGIYRVWTGAISYGTLTMFLTLSATLTGAMNTLIKFIPNTVSLVNSVMRIMELEALPKEDYSQQDEVRRFAGEHLKDGIGICVNEVTYAYGKGENVLEKVSFEAYPHEVIALVGPSGEGKTTILRYLLSIIRPQSGEGCLCAGHAGTDIPLTASVRQLMAYVPQGNTMFSGSIADNMRNVKEDATDEDIIEALKLACAWDFVKKLPQGIHSQIQERGGGFSEGQAQRLSIARALLRKSPILLLDEATSALDMHTEKMVLHNIMQDEYPRTTIVTTHRPSVLKQCNRVYSIHDRCCHRLSQEEIAEYIEG